MGECKCLCVPNTSWRLCIGGFVALAYGSRECVDLLCMYAEEVFEAIMYMTSKHGV